MSVPAKIRKRIIIVFFVAVVILATITTRLVWVQFVMGEELRQKAFEVRFRNVEVKAKRGVIYDAKGRALAISVSTASFYAIPSQVKKSGQEEEIARQIAKVLEMDEEAVKNAITKNLAFVWVKRHVPDEQAQVLKDLKLSGIKYVEEPERFYPKEELLSHVLGFAGIDNQGLNGIEVSYEDVLSGTPGTIMVEYDAKGQEIPDAVHKYIPPEDGKSIVLTIDETIQYIVERELDEIMKLRNPARAGIIVMEPATGNILAMGMRPAFDPNNYQSYDQSIWRNFLVSDAYEPGSTFKTVVAAGALEEGVVKLDDRFYCPGYIMVGKERIKCWSYSRPHGSQTFVEGVQNSCNPVFITVGLREGKEIFFRYLNGFGFGQKTGIALPGESLGIIVNEDKAKEIDIATMSIGQANAVTPLQLITAFSAICNGGELMKPQLVKEIKDKDGNLIETIEPEKVRQVISQETSKTLMEILETVVSQGTGKNAFIEGYRVVGKTGTAQKIIPGGGYSSSEYVSSFLGAAPVNDPKVAALVVIDTPQGAYYGGVIAAPAFKNVVEDTLRYLQVPAQVQPDKIAGGRAKTVILQNLEGKELDETLSILKQSNLKADIVGTGSVVKAQMPLPGSTVQEGSKVLLYTSIPAAENCPESVVVPDFTAMTVGEVKELTRVLNLNFEIRGSGVVVRQEPEPYIQVEVGSKVIVFLEQPASSAVEPLSP